MKSVWSDIARFGGRVVPDSVREPDRPQAMRGRMARWYRARRRPMLARGERMPFGRASACTRPSMPAPRSPSGEDTCAAPGRNSAGSIHRTAARRPMQGDPAIDAARDFQPPPSRRQRLAARAHAWRLLPALQRVRRLFRRDLRVLAYHRVRDLDAGFAFDPALVSAAPADFRRQMRYLRDH